MKNCDRNTWEKREEACLSDPGLKTHARAGTQNFDIPIGLHLRSDGGLRLSRQVDRVGERQSAFGSTAGGSVPGCSF